jgi:hypothetical protein
MLTLPSKLPLHVTRWLWRCQLETRTPSTSARWPTNVEHPRLRPSNYSWPGGPHRLRTNVNVVQTETSFLFNCPVFNTISNYTISAGLSILSTAPLCDVLPVYSKFIVQLVQHVRTVQSQHATDSGFKEPCDKQKKQAYYNSVTR